MSRGYARALAGTALLIGALLAGCGADHTTAAAPAAIPDAADWRRLSELRIAFGHQSVGYNLLDGIAALATDAAVPLRIVETREPFSAPAIHHFRIGENGKPAGKLADFDALMKSGLAGSTDIALLKLCFVDFEAEIDSKQLAQQYIDELARLAAVYPRVVFVPVTAPLTTAQTGPKAWLKRLLGRTPAGYVNNARRQLFNEALRDHYRSESGQSPLFDLAALESGYQTNSVDYNGVRVEVLDPALTTDGGHLNTQGQHLLGGALVHHLAMLKRQQ